MSVVRCAACNRPRAAGAPCVCGVSTERPAPTQPYASLESHLGIEPGERVTPEYSLTMTFGVPVVDPFPPGTKLVRRFRRWTEVEWSAPTEPDDQRWNDVLVLHYRGELSGPVSGPVPRLRQVREVRDGTAALFDALRAQPPPELGTFELHAPSASVRVAVEHARVFPALEFLVAYFLDDAGPVLVDELLERHAWLDCTSFASRSAVFRLRR